MTVVLHNMIVEYETKIPQYKYKDGHAAVWDSYRICLEKHNWIQERESHNLTEN